MVLSRSDANRQQVNVLQCFSVLNGNTVNVNILDAFY